ncbi:M20/M25/M40 family metallo-hydrolase [Asticcacaulis sp. DW145]|uniref:M28 family metallopeptidase n=1 Tax=Asticcacaulis sp. DW145 TaxID=3095608 RepID=UPI003090E494|nr:M20/M25/M40 family metallo-hydrolase [Asticcacaulis sp. DW145]
MSKPLTALAAAFCLSVTALGVHAQTVRPEQVRAHLSFLASDALQGRKSASRDEAIAAAYVAAQYESFGLQFAPTLSGFVQAAEVVSPQLDGQASLQLGPQSLAEGRDFRLLFASGQSVEGPLTFPATPEALTKGAVIVLPSDGKTPLTQWLREARSKGVKLVLAPDGAEASKLWDGIGGGPVTPTHLSETPPSRPRPDVVLLNASAYRSLKSGDSARLSVKRSDTQKAFTYNAIGFLPGTDPKAGVVLITAHLDHLGVKNGTIMPGANDDASGVAAVLELARALSQGPAPRRGVLFVCYGAEEAGLLGSAHFAAHPPIPLDHIVANLEVEMIGAQDPKLPKGTMMITGWERSNLADALKAKGALLAKDPYPEQHFYERSDNYSLALQGIVAHTVSGWATIPTYHSAQDTLGNIDIPYMTAAIQSLVEPVRWLVTGDFEPKWAENGRPKP